MFRGVFRYDLRAAAVEEFHELGLPSSVDAMLPEHIDCVRDRLATPRICDIRICDIQGAMGNPHVTPR